jgi:hypothetical protein
MIFFYLKGLDKIGPLSIDELKKVEGLTPNTLVWNKTLAEWTKISDLEELHADIFGLVETITPPPIPQEIIDKENETVQEVKKQEKQKSKFSAIRISVSIIVILITLGISYKIFDNKVEKGKTDLKNKIELIFQGKITVCDGVNYQVVGTLKKLEKPINWRILKKDSIISALDIIEHVYDDQNLVSYERKKNQGVVEEFTLTSGGFTVYKISKEDNGFVIERNDAKDMIYKVGLYENKYGFSMPSNRPSIEECYSGALDYLTVKNKDGSYTANTYIKIQNFAELRNDLFYIENVKKPTYPYASHWLKDEGSVYNSQYEVYLKKDLKYYEIIKNTKETTKLLLICLFIGLLVGSLVAIVCNIAILKLAQL